MKINQEKKKFLIIQTAFIGDVILATPIIEKLHSFYPSAQIDFLLRKGNETLLKDHPKINKLIVWDKKNNKYTNLKNIIKTIRQERYDYLINLQRFFSSGLISSLSNAKYTIGFDKNPLSFFFSKKIKHHIANTKQFIHEVDRNLALIKDLTDDSFVKPKLYPPTTAFKKIKNTKQYVCIAPASVWFTKQWPANKWIELINELDPNWRIYLLGSPSDLEACELIKKQSKHPQINNLAGQLSLLESAALMQGAIMNYVNDSAPLHLASAMNAAVTAIFCSTIPAFGFTPLSDKSKVVETKESLACRPCGLHGFKTCPKGHFKCANIEIKKLMETI